MDTYTITAIDAAGGITVTFSVDGTTQHISGLPLDDADLLHQALSRYAMAYRQGLESAAAAVQTPTVPDAITALVGQPQTVTSPPPAPEPAPEAEVSAGTDQAPTPAQEG